MCVALLSDTYTKTRDEDVYAWFMGSAVNQCGKSSGLTAPNGPAQTSLVVSALKEANQAADNIGLISLHGTGTPLGDPIEVGALGKALVNSQYSVTLASSKVSVYK